LKVTEMEPEYADGWVNIARAQIQEEQHGRSRAVLAQSTGGRSESGESSFFLGTALKKPGTIPMKLFKRLASLLRKYPRDRVVVNQIGNLLFRKKQFNEAIR